MTTLERPDTATASVATVSGLRKKYAAVEAVRGISFDLRPGEIFGLLGPNGAGKTTTIEVMEGLRPYDGGEVRVLGMDPWQNSQALKQRIGAALQSTVLPDKIKVIEALNLYAGFYDRKADINKLISRFQLDSKRGAMYDSLSGGQKQRLALALSLVNDPDLVFLDEPTAGLDAQVRRDLHGLIADLRSEGKTILLTTHYIEEAELLCDRVAIMVGGEIRTLGTPAELRRAAHREARVDVSFTAPIESADLASVADVARVETNGAGATLYTTNPATTVTALIRKLDTWGATLTEIDVTTPTLEDLYLELAGSAATEEKR